MLTSGGITEGGAQKGNDRNDLILRRPNILSGRGEYGEHNSRAILKKDSNSMEQYLNKSCHNPLPIYNRVT